MPKVNSICVLMADGASKNGPAKILSLNLDVETCGHVLISGTNGEGKTSNIIEPYLWLFDTSAGVKGRKIKDIYDPKNGRQMGMPYIFFIDWTLEAAAGEKLAVGHEHLLTGFMLDSGLTEAGNLHARFFHFMHGDDEFRRDWMGTIRKHGLKAYEKHPDGQIVPYTFDMISQSLKSAGARVFSTAEQRLFRESLENEYGFFRIKPYVVLMKVSAGSENAVGDLKQNKEFATDNGLMENLIVPMLATGVYEDEDRATLARNIAECADVEFRYKDTIARLETLSKIIDTAENISASATRHSQASYALIAALDSTFTASDGLESSAESLSAKRSRLERDQAELGASLTELKIKALSYDIHMASDKVQAAEQQLSASESCVKQTEKQREAVEEMILRRDLVQAHADYESAKGTMNGVRKRLEELQDSDVCKEADNLSASIWKAYESRIEAKRNEVAAQYEAQKKALDEAATARGERTQVEIKRKSADQAIGVTRSKRSSEEERIRELLRDAGRSDLFPNDATPDVAAIDSEHMRYTAEAANRKREAQTAYEKEKSLRADADARSAFIADARVDAAKLEIEHEKAASRAEDLAKLLADVEQHMGRRPRDISETEAMQQSLETKKASVFRERQEAVRRHEAVDAEWRRAEESVGHVPTPIKDWLDSRGYAYRTGETQIEMWRGQGVDVEALLSRCNWLPSILIVSSQIRDEVLAAARTVEDIEGRGLSYLVTEDEVAGEFWSSSALDNIIGLFNRKLVIDREAYKAALERERERIDERIAELTSAIEKIDEAKSSLQKVVEFTDRCGRFGFDEIQKEPLVLVQALDDKNREIEEATAEHAKLLDAASGAHDAFENAQTEGSRAQGIAESLYEASDCCRRLEQIVIELREKIEAVKRLEARASELNAAISDLEAAANDARFEARSIEKDIDGLVVCQRGYTVFDPKVHVLVVGDLENLVAQHKVLHASLDKSREELAEEHKRASDAERSCKTIYGRAQTGYGPYGSIEDALKRDTVSEAAYLKAKTDLATLTEKLSDRKAEARQASRALDECVLKRQERTQAFKKAYPNEEITPRADIIDTDFELIERRLNDRREEILRQTNGLGSQIRTLDKADRELKRSREDALALVSALRSHARPARIEYEDGGSPSSEDAIAASRKSAAKLTKTVQVFRESAQERRFATGLHTVCALADDGDAIKHADMYLMDPEKSRDLKDLLAATKEGCEYERISDVRVGALAKDRMGATRLNFIGYVNALVTKGRELEKLSGGTMRIDGLKNSHHKALPADDQGFEVYAEEWLAARRRRLVCDMEEAMKDPAKSSDPKSYAFSKAKSELFTRESLMEAWADYISAAQTGRRQSGLRPQLRVLRGEVLTDWQDWHDISNSAGEIAAATNCLFAALLCSIKPEKGKGGKKRDSLGIPIIMDGPFRSVSDFNKISQIFSLYEERNIQLIATSDEVSKSVSLSFPTEYRLFSRGSREKTPLVCAECICKESSMMSIAYIDENLGQRQLALDFS